MGRARRRPARGSSLNPRRNKQMDPASNRCSQQVAITEGTVRLLRDALAWSNSHQEELVRILDASIKEMESPIARLDDGMVRCNVWTEEKWEPMEISEAEVMEDISEMRASLKAARKGAPLEKPEHLFALVHEYLLDLFWEQNPDPHGHLALAEPIRKLLFKFAMKAVTKSDLAEYVLEGGVLDDESETVRELETADHQTQLEEE
jgi:hypothetical protein